MIVIDRDLFRASPQEIRDAKVLMTFLDGELVYEA
jgi:predicted amidohydrolase YtcJ